MQRGLLMGVPQRSEEHTSELQSRRDLVCRLLLEKKKNESRCARTPPFRRSRHSAVGEPTRALAIRHPRTASALMLTPGSPAARHFFFKESGTPRVLPLSPTRRLSV